MTSTTGQHQHQPSSVPTTRTEPSNSPSDPQSRERRITDDERASIISREQGAGAGKNYSTVSPAPATPSNGEVSNTAAVASSTSAERIPQSDGADESEQQDPKRREDGAEDVDESDGLRRGSRQQQTQTSSHGHEQAQQSSRDEEEEDQQRQGWWKRFLAKHGSLELENKASVARDHLALERTFLAWLRTSLSFASIGLAVTQLFRLHSAFDSNAHSSSHYQSQAAHLRQNPLLSPQLIQRDPSSSSPYDDHQQKAKSLAHLGTILGACFIGLGIFTLLVGFHRYFESQHYVVLGKFPASRMSIAVVAGLTGGLVVASLIAVVVVGPGVVGA
ncbi:MAG: hypothetical protein M1831_006992 [Alyxoria varia]|nr:MAG: hypothetical protein M1831_006992 [Alyxoria varia]